MSEDNNNTPENPSPEQQPMEVLIKMDGPLGDMARKFVFSQLLDGLKNAAYSIELLDTNANPESYDTLAHRIISLGTAIAEYLGQEKILIEGVLESDHFAEDKAILEAILSAPFTANVARMTEEVAKRKAQEEEAKSTIETAEPSNATPEN